MTTPFVYLRKAFKTKEEAEKKALRAKSLYNKVGVVKYVESDPPKGKEPHHSWCVLVSDHK